MKSAFILLDDKGYSPIKIRRFAGFYFIFGEKRTFLQYILSRMV